MNGKVKKQIKLDISGKTHIGLERSKNEDHFVIVNDQSKFDIEGYGILIAVADGMGGHPLGDVASRVACQEILKYYKKDTLKGAFSHELLKHLTNIVFNTHITIKKLSTEQMLFHNMGTTLTTMVIYQLKALVVHIGDTRIYRLRENSLVKLTKDHTLAQKLYEMGQIEEDDSYTNPLTHMLTQALGIEITDPFVKEYNVLPGDVYLLCSDGLYNMVSIKDIKNVLSSKRSSEEKCNNLISLALEAGGKDNITTIVVQVFEN